MLMTMTMSMIMTVPVTKTVARTGAVTDAVAEALLVKVTDGTSVTESYCWNLDLIDGSELINRGISFQF